MHIVIIFVLITSVVVYFCSRLAADPKYLDVLKTRVHSIFCHLLNLITDYYFGSSSSSIIGSDCWVTLFDILVTRCDNIVIIFCWFALILLQSQHHQHSLSRHRRHRHRRFSCSLSRALAGVPAASRFLLLSSSRRLATATWPCFLLRCAFVITRGRMHNNVLVYAKTSGYVGTNKSETTSCNWQSYSICKKME